MATSQSLFLRLAGEIRGPYSEAQLRDLVDGGAISRDTESAPSRDGPWTPLKSLPLGVALFPPPPEFRFKAADFDVANSGSAPPVDHRELIAAANRPPPASAHDALRNLADAPSPTPTEPNEVERMVREVARRDASARGAAPPPERKPSRFLKRLRTFTVIAFGGDAVIAALALSYGHLSDGLSLEIWIAWGLLFTFAVAILVFYLDSAD